MTLSDWFGPPAYNVSIACEKRKVIDYHTELIAFVLPFFFRTMNLLRVKDVQLVLDWECVGRILVCHELTLHCVLLRYGLVPRSDPGCNRFLG